MTRLEEGNRPPLSGAAALVQCGALQLGLAAAFGLLVALSTSWAPTGECPWLLAVVIAVILAALVQLPMAWVAWIRRCDRRSMLTWSVGFAAAVVCMVITGEWGLAAVVVLVTCGIMVSGVRESNSPQGG